MSNSKRKLICSPYSRESVPHSLRSSLACWTGLRDWTAVSVEALAQTDIELRVAGLSIEGGTDAGEFILRVFKPRFVVVRDEPSIGLSIRHTVHQSRVVLVISLVDASPWRTILVRTAVAMVFERLMRAKFLHKNDGQCACRTIRGVKSRGISGSLYMSYLYKIYSSLGACLKSF